MRGRDVRVLQDFLTRAGLRTTVDGQFGRGTARKVRAWERRAERRVDGRVSRADARALRAGGRVERRARAGRARRPGRAQGRGRRRRARDRAGRRAAAGPGDHRGRQRDRHQAVQVRRRARQVGGLGLRLLGLGVLRLARRRAARRGARLHRLHELGRGRQGPVGDDLRQGQPRLHGRRRAALRHQRPRQRRARAGRRTCARARATPSVTPKVSKPRAGKGRHRVRGGRARGTTCTHGRPPALLLAGRPREQRAARRLRRGAGPGLQPQDASAEGGAQPVETPAPRARRARQRAAADAAPGRAPAPVLAGWARRSAAATPTGRRATSPSRRSSRSR